MLQPTVPMQYDNCKVRFIFKGPGEKWSEVHWTPNQFPASLPDVMAAALPIAVLRCAILGQNNNLIRIEATCPGFPRNTMRDSSSIINPGYAQKENQGNDSYRILMRAGPLTRASLYLGGIPDDIIGDDTSKPPTGAAWYAPMRAYLNAMIAAGWGVMGREQDPNIAPRVRVLSIGNTDVARNTIVVTTVADHKILAGVYRIARIGGVVGATAQRPFNKMWEIQVTGARTFNLLGFPFQTDTWTVSGSGYAQYMLNVFTAYTGFKEKEPDTRKRGNRTENPPARRKLKRTLGY